MLLLCSILYAYLWILKHNTNNIKLLFFRHRIRRKNQTRTLTWTCKVCGIVLTSRKYLNQHTKDFHGVLSQEIHYNYTYNILEGNFSCKSCDMEANTKEEIEKHVLMHEEKFECFKCQDIFYSAYKFSVHLKRQHNDEVYRCPLCKYNTPRVTSIAQHINLMHLKKYIHNCQYCGKGFHDISVFREHENVHLGADPLTCIVCEKTFLYTRNLITHQIRNHTVTILGVPVANQCGICKRIFSRPNTLLTHMKRHERKKPLEKTHLCDSCGKGFARRNKLMLHYRVHTGYKPYKCSYCDKCFTKRDYLVLHERIHSGEKPYCCVFCGKCFNQDASLRIHVRTHTGERPYVCEFCSNGFVSRASLKVHQNGCSGL